MLILVSFYPCLIKKNSQFSFYNSQYVTVGNKFMSSTTTGTESSPASDISIEFCKIKKKESVKDNIIGMLCTNMLPSA